MMCGREFMRKLERQFCVTIIYQDGVTFPEMHTHAETCLECQAPEKVAARSAARIRTQSEKRSE